MRTGAQPNGLAPMLRIATALVALPAVLAAFWIMPGWHGDFSNLPGFRHGYLFVHEPTSYNLAWFFPAYQPLTKPSFASGIRWGMECYATADIDVSPSGDEVESQVGARSCADSRIYGEVGFLQPNRSGLPVVASIVRFDDFLPLGVCYDLNQDVWVAGRSADGAISFRKYRKSGDELGNFSSGIRVPGIAMLGQPSAVSARSHLVELTASTNNIGTLVRSHDGSREWEEIGLDGHEEFRTSITDNTLVNFAYTVDGRLYSQKPGPNGAGGELLELDHTSGEWHSSGSLESYRILIGADGRDLAFVDNRVDSSVTVTRVPQPPR